MIKEYLKLGRIEFAGFLICTMVSGGLCIKGENLQILETWPVFIVAVLSNVWGFAHNDLHDLKLDSRSVELASRPLVKGTILPANAIIYICFSLFLIFITVLFITVDWERPLLVFCASVILSGLYNMFSKQLPGLDLLFAASTGLLCYLGGLLISEVLPLGNREHQLLVLVSLIYFLDFTVFNMGATLKDVNNDLQSKAKTVAVTLGVRVENNDKFIITATFTLVLLIFKILSLILLLITATRVGSGNLLILLFFLGALSLYLTYDATRVKVFDRQDIGRRWLKQDALGKLLLPVLLFPIIGFGWFLFLSIFPFLWFLFASIYLYGKGNRLHSGF